MKTRFLLPVCLLTALAAVSAREFTDLQGRKLDAELAEVVNDRATLIRAADGRSFNVEIASFSAEDQKFMKAWGEANMKYRFEVRAEKKKTGEKDVQGGGLTGKTERWVYEISMRNLTQATASGLKARCWVFTKEMAEKGRMPARPVIICNLDMRDMPFNGTCRLVTMPVSISRVRAAPGYYIDGASSKSDMMAGLVIRVYNKDKREVFNYATDKSLLAY